MAKCVNKKKTCLAFRFVLGLVLVAVFVCSVLFINITQIKLINRTKNAVLQELETNTGFKISYDRISPNILTSLNIYNVTLTNKQGIRLELGTIEVGYSIFRVFLIPSSSNGAFVLFKTVKLKDFQADITKQELLTLIDNLKKTFAGKTQSNSDFLDKIKNISFRVPVAGLTIHDGETSLNVVVHNLRAEFDNAINVGADINVVYNGLLNQTATVACSIGGKIDRLDGQIRTDLRLALNKAHIINTDVMNLNFAWKSVGSDFSFIKLENAMNLGLSLTKVKSILTLTANSDLTGKEFMTIVKLPTSEKLMFDKINFKTNINLDLNQKNKISGALKGSTLVNGFNATVDCETHDSVINIKNATIFADKHDKNVTISGVVPIFESQRKLNVNFNNFVFGGIEIAMAAVLNQNKSSFELKSDSVKINGVDFGAFGYNFAGDSSFKHTQLSTTKPLNGYDIRGSIVSDNNKNRNIYLRHSLHNADIAKLLSSAGINLDDKHSLFLNGTFDTNIVGGKLSMPTSTFKMVGAENAHLVSGSVSMSDNIFTVNKMKLLDGKLECGGKVSYDKSALTSNLTIVTGSKQGEQTFYNLNANLDRRNIKLSINNLAKLTFNLPAKKLYLTSNNFPVTIKDNKILVSCNFVGDLTKKVVNQSTFSIDNLKLFNDRLGKLTATFSYDKNLLELSNCTYADGSNNITGSFNANLTDISVLTDNVSKVKPGGMEKINFDKLRVSGSGLFVDEKKKESYSLDYLVQDGNVDAKLYLTNFAINKLGLDNLGGLLNARIHAVGSLKNPIVDIQGETDKAHYGKNKLDLSFALKKDMHQVNVKKATINLGNQSLKINNSTCSLSNGYKNFNLSANVYLKKLAKVVKSDVNITGSFAEFSKDTKFAADISLKNISISYLKAGNPVDFEKFGDIKFSCKHKDGLYTLFNYGQKFIDISIDTVKHTGFANIYKNKTPILQANYANVINSQTNQAKLTGNVKIRKLPANLAHRVVYPHVGITDGLLDGNLIIGGTVNNPTLNGKASLYYGSVEIKDYLADPINNITAIIVFDNNKMYVNNVNGMVKKGLVHANGEVVFNKGKFENFHFDITSNTVPTRIKKGPVDAVGTGRVESFAMDGQPGNFNFAGNIVLESAEVNLSNFGSLASGKTKKQKRTLPLNVELNFIAGEKLKVNYPIVNVQVKPGEVFTFHYAGSEPAIYLGGEIGIEKGVLNYFNKEFKIENASFTFYDDEQKINPFVNLKSYYRTKDGKNNNVVVYLTINDRLSSFKTNVSAIPYRTVSEINSLLGTAFVTNDEERDVYDNYNYTPDIDNVVNTTNYLSSAFMFSSVENAVKRITGFDTFSVTTSIFGNMIKSNNNWLDLIDNTELTFGKYLTNELYIGSAMSFQKLSGSNHLFLPFQDNNYGINMELFMQLELPYLSIGYKFLPKDYSNILKSEHQISVEANFKF